MMKRTRDLLPAPVWFGLELMAVWLAVLLFMAALPLNVCRADVPVNFDSHNLISWEFLAFDGALPYREVKLVYGLWHYFKSVWLSAYLAAVVAMSSLITGLYGVWRKNWGRSIALTGIASLLLTIITLAGSRSFWRYGWVLIVPAIGAWLIGSKQGRLTYWGWGVISGALVMLMPDIGLMVTLISGLYVAVLPWLLEETKERLVAPEKWRRTGIFGGGVVVGMMPGWWWLAKQGLLSDFWGQMQANSSLLVSAKIPINLAQSGQGAIFLLLSFGLGLISMSYRRRPRWQSESWALLAGTWGASWALYAKNLIRPQFDVMAVVGVILGTSMIGYGYGLKTKKSRSVMVLSIGAIIALPWVFGPKTIVPQLTHELGKIGQQLGSLGQTGKAGLGKAWLCRQEDFAAERLPLGQSQRQLIEQLPKIGIGEAVSLPYEPVLSIPLGTRPVPSLTVYDAADRVAQNMNITYLETTVMPWIIYSVNHGMIDNVPEYIRSADLTAYVLTHYAVDKAIGDYFLWQRQEEVDFKPETLFDFPALQSHFQEIEMGYMTALEGRKLARVNEGTAYTWAVKGTASAVNQYLESSKDMDEELGIYVRADERSPSPDTVLEMDNGRSATRVSLRGCGSTGCMLRVKRVPWFYGQQKLKHIQLDDGFRGEVGLLKLNMDHDWW